MKKKAGIPFLCILYLFLPLWARSERGDQPEIIKLEPIVITADRLPQPVSKFTSSVVFNH